MDLGEEGQDILARHLGHDIRVHRSFYRQHPDIVERGKVTKLLVAMEEGRMASFAGKTIEQMDEVWEVEQADANNAKEVKS